MRDLCFFLRNPARIGNESARIGLRLIFNGELAIRIKAFTAVKRVISFFSLDKVNIFKENRKSNSKIK